MVLIVKCSCDTGDKGSPSQATTALKNAPGITDVGCAFGAPSALEPLVIWFFLQDSQSPKASVGKALLLFSLQLSGIICGLFLFPSLLEWVLVFTFPFRGSLPRWPVELARRDVVYGFNGDCPHIRLLCLSQGDVRGIV